MPTSHIVEPLADLPELARQIREHHKSAQLNACSAVEQARLCGERLLDAKAQVKHGQWLAWLTDNCRDLTERTAQLYMQLAREWPELEAANPQRVADLSIRATLEQLPRKPRPRPAPAASAQALRETFARHMAVVDALEKGSVEELDRVPPAIPLRAGPPRTQREIEKLNSGAEKLAAQARTIIARKAQATNAKPEPIDVPYPATLCAECWRDAREVAGHHMAYCEHHHAGAVYDGELWTIRTPLSYPAWRAWIQR